MNFKISIIILLFPLLAISQNKMTLLGNKVYAGTEIWNFISPNYALTGEVTVQIAKTENGGLLKLSVATTNPEFVIKGTVYVYLANNTIITCVDKGSFDSTTNTITSYFIFSNSEMQQLKKHDIQSIRFNIDGKNTTFSSQIGNFTAVNKKSSYSTTYKSGINKFQTAKEIQLLFS
jgi:hypothetical protein